MSSPADSHEDRTTLGPRQAAVLAHLREHPGLTAWELARAFGLRSSITDVLRRLEQRAEVVAVISWAPNQGRRVSRWHVAPPGTVPPPQPRRDPHADARRRERNRLAARARRVLARGLTAQPGSEPPPLRNRPAAVAVPASAGCRSADPDLFFGPEGELAEERDTREAKAKTICASCPVRARCYARAVARGERYGVWGGESFETKRKGRKAS